jgi:hypothetical protein
MQDEYEKIKRIVIQLDKAYLLYITTSARADHSKILRQATILKLKQLLTFILFLKLLFRDS